MIRATWVDPNFKIQARDNKDKLIEFICHAVDPPSLEERLKGKHLKVISITPYDFGDWRKKAAKYKDKAIWQRIKGRWSYVRGQARANWTWLTPEDLDYIDGAKQRLIEKIVEHDGSTEDVAAAQIDSWSADLKEEVPAPGQKLPKVAIKFTDSVWQELKWHLFELFHGKCAYCENKSLAGYSGDVEHYRPKGKVDDDEDHPGYYWLAYDETNLLPSCALCNQPQRAKRTRFPVKDDAHAREARSLVREVPLLLNPYDTTIDPFDHLEFGETGLSAAHNNSEYGKSSRDVYDLDRSELAEARYNEMRLIEADWTANIGQKRDIAKAYADLRADILRGEREYSAALLWALDRLRLRAIQDLMAQPGIRPPPASPTIGP